MTDRPVRILGLGTAVPSSVQQAQIIDIAVNLIDGSEEQRALLRRIYSRSGVVRRGIVLEQSPGALAAFYQPNQSPATSTRMQAYERFAPGLAESAALKALADANTPASQVTHLITVSCTGFVSPGVDAALIERMGLSRSVKRINIGFMGCHAALNAFEAARSIARGSPDARVLICCVELCSLHLAYEWEMQRIVSNALFADGAAAAVVSQSDDDCWQIIDAASFLLPETKRDMGWTIGDDGFKMTLSAQVPMYIQRHIRSWCDAWLGEAATKVHAIDHWAIHPGGPKVLDAAAAGLGVSPELLNVSRDVLREHGNMSSGTVLFILERLGNARGQCVSLAFGPGLVMEGLLLRR